MIKIMINKVQACFFCMLFFLVGCEATHLVYVQESSLGLNIGAGTEGSQKFSFGYDRDIYAIVPKKSDTEDAMSLFSVNHVEASSLRDIEVSEFVASGVPASKIAKEPDSVNAFRQKINSSAGE